MYTIHQVWPSACRSKQLLYESDRFSSSISELSLSYSSALFYGSIGTEGVSDADSQSGVVEPYRYAPDRSNSPSSYASHDLNDHEDEERLANDWYGSFVQQMQVFTSTRSFTYTSDFMHVDVHMYVRSCNCEVMPTAMECVQCILLWN